jgi:4-amino-4-deoxy-L-arabinose transferase-like glycosyltransferase
LGLIIATSLAVKAALIFTYNNRLTLSSDDLNYLKSAAVILKRGIFTFQNFNEPTVFVMPLYPLFLATILKFTGFGILGMQTVRIIQAVLSCITVLLVWLTGRKLFDDRVALLASLLTAFYLPNITTAGYFLTETLFTLLLMVLVFYSLKFADNPSKKVFAVLGVMWAVITLCRPTIVLYPLLLAVYCFFYKRMRVWQLIKLCSVMALSFAIVMSPWWVRNFKEYGKFIPLAASSGNPMLQGTYVDYNQSPDEVVYYPLGKNALETNSIEVGVAKERIKNGFRKDFWGYLSWYTVKKTVYYWCGTFYWQEVFGISKNVALALHYVLILGLPGIIIACRKNYSKYILPLSVILYFNLIHCLYMAFDRYAFPMMTLLSIFSSFLIVKSFYYVKERFYT